MTTPGHEQATGRIPAILLSTGSLYLHPIPTAFELARAAGCDGVELDISPDYILRGPAPVLRASERTGLPVRAVHPPLYALPGWLGEETMVRRLVAAALTLGARVVVLHPPRMREDSGARMARLVALLRQAQECLAEHGAGIVLENPGFFHERDGEHPLWHLPALRRLAEACGLSLALDTAHAGSSPIPLMESYALVRDRLAHVHLSDLRPPRKLYNHPFLHSFCRDHQLPGHGNLPLQALLHALVADGYRGDITLELSPISLHTWRLAEARRLLAQAVVDTRRVFVT